MSRWVVKGLRGRCRSSQYPVKEEKAPGVSPGIIGERLPQGSALGLRERCPMGVICDPPGGDLVDRGRCIHCLRCGPSPSLGWEEGFEWARFTPEGGPLPPSFKGSVHIRVVDVGDCGACLNEVKLLNNPYYNMHRSGLFITPTPRKADVLLVVGRLTEHMKIPLIRTYEAMPSPKRVVVVGACGLSGGIFERDFITPNVVQEMLPVDVEVPGCPPPPLAIYHALLLVSGQMKGEYER